MSTGRHYVYMYLNADEELIYVGMTMDLVTRDRAHKSKPWYSEAVEQRHLGPMTYEEAVKLEWELLQARPKYNRTRENGYTGPYSRAWRLAHDRRVNGGDLKYALAVQASVYWRGQHLACDETCDAASYVEEPLDPFTWEAPEDWDSYIRERSTQPAEVKCPGGNYQQTPRGDIHPSLRRGFASRSRAVAG